MNCPGDPKSHFTERFVLILIFIVGMWISVIYGAIADRKYEIRGTIEKVELIWVDKFFWGDTYHIKVKVKGKEELVLHGSKKEETQIQGGGIYIITYYAKDSSIYKVDRIE